MVKIIAGVTLNEEQVKALRDYIKRRGDHGKEDLERLCP
jgi:hypothetical protein